MWNDARRLNLAAGALTGAALTVFCAAALVLLLRSPGFPVREVLVLGSPRHVAREDVEAALASRIEANFFAVDLRAMRTSVEEIAWVRRASLRRIWPDRIAVTIEEHRPLARWNGADLVNLEGERFFAAVDAVLPAFSGPPGREAEVAERYRRLSGFVRPLGVTLETIALSARNAWRIDLSNGLEILLGRDSAQDPIEARVARFVDAYPETLGKIARRHVHVDLRYPNGFALRVPELGRTDARPASAKGARGP